MHRRILACLVALASLAMGQRPISVQELITFVQSQTKMIKQKKATDQETAKYLATVRLKEKLDVDVVEDLQSDGAGPQTVNALKKLMEQSKNLTAVVIPKALPDEPIPIPTSEEQGRILDDVRAYVKNYDEGLPDFICKEVEERAVAGSRGRPGGEPAYRPVDTITSKITYFNHREDKTPLLNGSRPVTGDYEKLGGATSRGDFETALVMLFAPDTQARFEFARWVTWRMRLTLVFRFKVSQDRSQYKIGLSDHKTEMFAAYSGEVYVDAQPPHAVVRLKTKAEEIPVDFPIQLAESTLDYAYQDIGGQKFLLPETGEIKMDGPDWVSKNTNRFEFYRKYEVGSSISYGDFPADTPAPVLKESAPEKPKVDCKDPNNKDLPQCKVKQ